MTSLRSKVIRLAHAKPELRTHLLPLVRTASFGADDVFDFFDADDSPIDPVTQARLNITKELGGGDDQIKPLAAFVKPGTVQGLDPGVYYWRNKGWAIRTQAASKSEATRIGIKTQANLIAPAKVSPSEPHVHTLPLFVLYGAGDWVKLPPVEKKVRVPTGPSITDKKDALVAKGQQTFGPRSIQVSGSEDRGYTLSITPTEPRLKKLFRPSVVRDRTLEELDGILDKAIEAGQNAIR